MKKENLPEFQELRSILSTMDVPNMRFVNMDMGWFARNLSFNNDKHPKFDRAIELIKFIVKNQ